MSGILHAGRLILLYPKRRRSMSRAPTISAARFVLKTLEDEDGRQVRLKRGAEVEVIFQADKDATEPKSNK
jgi:hypothetical protein